MEAYALDWVQLLIRWVHLITGVAWIGASFYFVFLDNSLLPPKRQEDIDAGIGGELWAIHGGGF
ncbi:MAG: urate hydroxylase PuuD, partial [Betaproteobacteria bacterium]